MNTTGPLRRTLHRLTAVTAPLLLCAMPLAAPASTTSQPATSTTPSGPGSAWIGTWSASPVIPGDSGDAADGFTDETVRNVVHTSTGGGKVRIRLSNAYGGQPLTIEDSTVAKRSDGASVRPDSVRQLTYGGEEVTTIPVGAEVVSDPVRLRVPAGTDLAVSTYFEEATGPVTQHPVANATSYSSTAGNQTDTAAGDAYDRRAESWFVLDGVDVRSARAAGSVVTFGDSITDGNGSTLDANRRWPDELARRVQEAPGGLDLGVLNQGISGNRILNDADTRGNSAQARFDNDVLSQTGVRTVIITEGINDIRYLEGPNGEPLTAETLIAGIHNLVRRAHAHDLTVLGGTLLPYGGSDRFTEEGERIRQQVNRWIRTGGAFDGVVDFDKVTRDPDDPQRMAAEYDSGDHLHPGDAGYAAMAAAVPLGRL